MLKILITGAGGQVGQDLVRALAAHRATALERPELDVTDATRVTEVVNENRPDVVLNTAAYNHVDRAEDEPGNALRVNALGPRALATACHAAGALLVHFSTDYVFGGEGRTPRLEHDPPFPRGVYAISKLAGEQFVRAICPRHVVIRTSGVYGLHGQGGKGGNFVETMLGLAGAGKPLRVVNDQTLAPTFSADLAGRVAELLAIWERDRANALLGTYHLVNSGSCTWFDFAAAIFRLANVSVDLRPIPTSESGRAAPRPVYSVLSPGRFRALGLADLRGWNEALADYLGQRARTRTAVR